MGSFFGYFSCRAAIGGFAGIGIRLFSSAVNDSVSRPPVNGLARFGYPRILGGVPRDFLLFGWWKVVGDLIQAGMRIVKIASVPAAFSGQTNCYALGGGR